MVSPETFINKRPWAFLKEKALIINCEIHATLWVAYGCYE